MIEEMEELKTKMTEDKRFKLLRYLIWKKDLK